MKRKHPTSTGEGQRMKNPAGAGVFGGRYWTRTSDLFRVKETR